MSALGDLLSKRLIFVTGKGGVGKTTVAAALGFLAAKEGRRTLLCELEPKGEIARYYGHKPGGFQPLQVRENLWTMEMSTEEAIYEYLRVFLRLPIPPKLTPLAKTLDFVANAAPGVREILVVGKLCWEVRQNQYDVIIADASASGHVISQLSSPRGVGDLFPVGMVKDQTGWMLDILSDPAQTGIAVVSTAEETPIEEAVELVGRLKSETVVSLAAAIINKIVPSVLSPLETTMFQRVREGSLAVALDDGLGGGLAGLGEATELWQSMAMKNQNHAARLRDTIAGEVPLIEVPTVPGVNMGFGVIREVAETMEVELG